ncbi:zinc finger protein hypothetical protein [Limosa lapponica baueri]|uniref:C2H2-type domain-containing protein n=1 Tax=Limosa lapponica baueri TaxID=1758121 RepID=A0A2I0UK21_LIMLA|nr:zinc finger protein hypothetical protein [Limosa lapponica baueri]
MSYWYLTYLSAFLHRERLVHELDTTGELLVDLGSDQTSCHNPFSGGYYPVQLGFEEAKQLLSTNPGKFRMLVQESLKRQVAAINRLADKGMFFWDYGNAFLLEAQRAGADVEKKGANKTEFRYPSYVQHIMGDIFSLGFGPFRWVCTSGDPQDLATTDSIAMSVLEDSIRQGVSTSVKQQYHDNIRWIREAGRHSLVVGSQARILYSDQRGRVSIAVAINRAISEGRIKAPVVLSRDHHDVSGTDSPYRETSNIYDGSAFCAGCCAKFSARSSLYIHSKKHLQDVDSLKTRCPVSSCNKLFTSKHSMKTHMVKQHNFSPDLLTQLEATSSLTPSSELTSPGQSDLSNIDLVSLFSNVSSNNSGITTDMALVNSGIVTIDVASVGSTLGGSLPVSNSSLSQAVDPLILVASSDMPQSLDSSLLLGTGATVLQQSTLNLDDVQTVNAEALGSLASLSVRNSSQDVHGLTSSNNLTIDTATLTPSSSLGSTTVPELLTPTKVERNLLPSSDVVGQQEGSKVVTQFVFSNPPGSYSAQKEMDLGPVTGSSFLVRDNYICFTPV